MKLAQIQKGENNNANDEDDFKKMNTKNILDLFEHKEHTN